MGSEAGCGARASTALSCEAGGDLRLWAGPVTPGHGHSSSLRLRLASHHFGALSPVDATQRRPGLPLHPRAGGCSGPAPRIPLRGMFVAVDMTAFIHSVTHSHEPPGLGHYLARKKESHTICRIIITRNPPAATTSSPIHASSCRSGIPAYRW